MLNKLNRDVIKKYVKTGLGNIVISITALGSCALIATGVALYPPWFTRNDAHYDKMLFLSTSLVCTGVAGVISLNPIYMLCGTSIFASQVRIS